MFAGLLSGRDKWVKICGIIKQVQGGRICGINFERDLPQLGTLRGPWSRKQTVNALPIASRFDFDAAGFDQALQKPAYGGAEARLESKRLTEFGG